MQFFIFGTGLFFERRKDNFDFNDIIAFVDNNEEKIGSTLYGRKIISHKEISRYKYDFICIMTNNANFLQIKEQLLLCGIKSDKIISYEDYKRLTKRFEIYSVDDLYSCFDFGLCPGKKLNKELNLVDSGEALITIITPFYNKGLFFEETFNSVMNQTFPWFEWIIIDDGSTSEEDLRILHFFVEKDKRIRVIQQPNGGPSSARNTGFKNAKTNIVIPLDADDVILPTYLEYLYFGLYFNPDCDFAFTWVVSFWDEKYLACPKWSTEKITKSNFLTCTAAIRKKAWEEVGGYKIEKRPYNEDWRFWLDMLSRHKKPLSLGGFGFWYRRTKIGRRVSVQDDTRNNIFDQEIIKNAAKTVDFSITAKEYPISMIKCIDYSMIPVQIKKLSPYSKEKNVIMILPCLDFSDLSKSTLERVRQMRQLGYDITIITTQKSWNGMQQQYQAETDYIYNLPDFLSAEHYVQFIGYYIESKRIDNIITQNQDNKLLVKLKEWFPNIRYTIEG